MSDEDLSELEQEMDGDEEDFVDFEDEDVDDDGLDLKSSKKEAAKQHVQQLQRLQEKDPEFYQYLKETDKLLLEFDDKDIEDDETDAENDKESVKEEANQPRKVITMEMVDRWCKGIKDGDKKPVRAMLHAFHVACHYDVSQDDASAPRYTITSSAVFNKVMVFVLTQMDTILRELLRAPPRGGKKETVLELMTTKPWKRYGHFMRSFLGNALQILTEMTDEQMISFTLKHVKPSAVFLSAFPSIMRKYLRVALHTWGTGKGAMPVVSLLFLRDMCIQLGSDVLGTCLKGIYKAYVANCKLAKSVSSSKQQQIQFLINCVTEIYGVDPARAYQCAFIFIRQLAIILRGVHTERGPKAVKDNSGKKPKEKKDQKSKVRSKPSDKQIEKTYQKVYDWQYLYCLELWTNVICTFNSDTDFGHLAYPLTQIIYGVASLVPTARYIPLRLRCVRMLNRIAKATGTYIPVSSLLLDMLEMKELRQPPAGGVGKAIDLLNIKQVDKTTLKTRSFQEACLYAIIEALAEHLSQWSYSVAFFEMSFLTLVHLRSFLKSIKAERFRKEIKELVNQLESNCEFTNSKRARVNFSPNDPAVESFLEAEKEEESSPLSKYAKSLHERARNRSDAMVQSSIVVGSESSFVKKLPDIDHDDEHAEMEEGAAIFSLPNASDKDRMPKEKKSKKRTREQDVVATDEDVVEDLVLSSDEEEVENRDALLSDEEEEDDKEQGGLGRPRKKQKPLAKKVKKAQNSQPRASSGKRRHSSSSRPHPKKLKR